jgi:predicted Zn-dependent peptidase
VKQEQAASHVFSRVGTFGWIGTRDPTTLDVMAYVERPEELDRVVALIDEEIARVTEDVTDEELARVTNTAASEFFQDHDSLIGRTVTMGVLEQQRGRAELINEIPPLLGSVTANDVAEIAGTWLKPNQRARLDWLPGAPS